MKRKQKPAFNFVDRDMKITSEWNLRDGDKFAECQTMTKNCKFPTSEFYSSGDTNIRKKNHYCTGQQSQHHYSVVLCLLYGD